MKLYIAAPWTHRDAAQQLAAFLLDDGHTITHDWWNYDAPDTDYDKLEYLALLDWASVLRADLVVLLNVEQSEGKAVEQGIAISHNIPIVGIGEHPTNIFQNIRRYYKWVATVDELRAYLLHKAPD